MWFNSLLLVSRSRDRLLYLVLIHNSFSFVLLSLLPSVRSVNLLQCRATYFSHDPEPCIGASLSPSSPDPRFLEMLVFSKDFRGVFGSIYAATSLAGQCAHPSCLDASAFEVLLLVFMTSYDDPSTIDILL